MTAHSVSPKTASHAVFREEVLGPLHALGLRRGPFRAAKARHHGGLATRQRPSVAAGSTVLEHGVLGPSVALQSDGGAQPPKVGAVAKL